MTIEEQTLLLMFQSGKLYVTSEGLEVVAPLDVDFDWMEKQVDWVNWETRL